MVVDGQSWYIGNQTMETSNSVKVKEFRLGSHTHNLEASFEGEISEFNIWSTTLTFEQMKQITSNCGPVEPKPDILDWSKVTKSMIKGSSESKEIRDLCYHSIDKKETIVPVLLNQVEALQVCNTMGSKMTYNKTLSEYHGIIFSEYISIS